MDGWPRSYRGSGLPAHRFGRALLALALLASGACASSGGGRVPAEDPGAGSPERAASSRLVERGTSLLSAGRAEAGASVLERAVRVDPSNGRAYLELARARMALGEDEVARGLLERAAALLRPYPEEEARVDSLRARLDDRGGRERPRFPGPASRPSGGAGSGSAGG